MKKNSIKTECFIKENELIYFGKKAVIFKILLSKYLLYFFQNILMIRKINFLTRSIFYPSSKKINPLRLISISI